MVNLEKLRAEGLRAYEVGRLRAALRAAIVVVPVAILCALETGEREACACLGVLLLGATVFLRWQNRRGMEAVTTGLVAGAVSLLVGLVVSRFAPSCAGAEVVSLCTAVCVAAGIASGAIIGLRANRGHAGLVSILTASCIAIIAASMGCLGLGAAGIVGAGAGLLLGGTFATLGARATR